MNRFVPMRLRAAHVFIAVLFLFSTACRRPAATPPAPNASPIEVKVWHGSFSDELEQHLDSAVAAFHARHDSIRVVLERHPGHPDAAIRRLQLKLALGERPDLVWLPPVYTGDLAQAGVLRPVDHFAARDTSFDPDAILPVLWETAMHDGTRYTLPIQANTLAIYYNRRAFDEAGITHPPATWEELADVAQRLTRDRTGDGTIDRYGLLLPQGSREWTVWTWQTFLWQAGGAFMDPTEPEPLFDSDAGVEALRYWIDLVYEREAALLSAPNAGWDVQPFVEERVAMQIGGPWDLPYLDGIDTLDYGVFPLPRHRERATVVGGENLYLMKSTPEREQAAWRLAKHLVAPDVQRSLATAAGYFPVRRSSVASKWFAEHLTRHPAYRTFYEAFADGRSRPAMTKYFSVSLALGKQLQAALARDTSPDSALHAAAEQARLLLADPAARDRLVRAGADTTR